MKNIKEAIEIPMVRMEESGEINAYIRTTPFTDKSGMFEDFNFKLIIIDKILKNTPDFYERYKELEDKAYTVYRDSEQYGCIEEIVEYFENLVLTQEDLDKVTEIDIDPEDIHGCIWPDWDGEDDIFNITSIKGCEILKNVKKVWHLSGMCEDELVEELKRIYKID